MQAPIQAPALEAAVPLQLLNYWPVFFKGIYSINFPQLEMPQDHKDGGGEGG